MTAILFVVGILVMAFGIGLSIALHELGHLVPAKHYGVKVTQYMIGFGPTLWARKFGETEYGIKAIPFGGYCRMIGMFPPRPGDDPNTIRLSSTGRFSGLADEARRTSLAEVEPGDEGRVFYKLSSRRKFTIMLGGILMNLAFAAVLVTGLVTLYGVGVVKPGATVAAVYECVVPVDQAAQTKACATTAAKTPAYLAGLKPGDSLVSIAGTPVKSTTTIGTLVSGRVGQAVPVVVERDGRQVALTVTPVTNTLPVYDGSGQPVLDAAGKPTYHETGFIGISSAPLTATERQSVTVVPSYVWHMVASTGGLVLHIPQKIVGVAQAAFGDGERDPNGPISIVGVGRVAGEATAGMIPGLPSDTAGKIAVLVNLLAGLNIALFVFNLVPLLPMDGGHAAGAVWEAVKRAGARVLRRPDPGYVDVAKAMPLTYAISLALIAMSVLLIYADIVNPVKIGG